MAGHYSGWKTVRAGAKGTARVFVSRAAMASAGIAVSQVSLLSDAQILQLAKNSTQPAGQAQPAATSPFASQISRQKDIIAALDAQVQKARDNAASLLRPPPGKKEFQLIPGDTYDSALALVKGIGGVYDPERKVWAVPADALQKSAKQLDNLGLWPYVYGYDQAAKAAKQQVDTLEAQAVRARMQLVSYEQKALAKATAAQASTPAEIAQLRAAFAKKARDMSVMLQRKATMLRYGVESISGIQSGSLPLYDRIENLSARERVLYQSWTKAAQRAGEIANRYT